MTYVLSSAKLNATGLRWVGELADFNFNIKYRPGKCHIDADSFSRMPFDINKYMPECTESISEETVKTMYQSQALHGLAPKCKLINMHELINKSTNDYVTLLPCENGANVNNKG